MTRPNGVQIIVVIHMSGIAPPGSHGYLATLLSPACEPGVRADALSRLRQAGGLMARYCDDYERAETPTSACWGRNA